MSHSALPTIALPGGWEGLFDGPAVARLERDVLPGYLPGQRWFGGKARRIGSVRVADWGAIPGGSGRAFLVLLRVAFADGAGDLYALPLAVSPRPAAQPGGAIARLEGPAGGAVLYDAIADEAVCSAVLAAVGRGDEFPTRFGRARGVPTAAFARLRGDAAAPLPVSPGPATSSNSLVFFGDRLVLKLFRRLEEGVNPDFEIGRFLTESGRFDRIPRVAGAIEYNRADGGGPFTLAIVQAVVPNGGDGWAHALAELGGYYGRAAARSDRPDPDPRPLPELAAAAPPPGAAEAIGDYLRAAETLGRRTAELHLALAAETADPAFAPEPLTAADTAALRDELLAQGRTALAALHDNFDRLPAEVARDARRLLAVGPAALDRLTAEPSSVPAAVKTRVHGDYHLGQVLWVGDDYVILDFEGEPTRTVAERRGKFSPVRDVAGMLRSYHYAAYAGLFAFARDRPADVPRLAPWADLWHQWVCAAFLRAYRAAAGGAAFLPRRPEEFAALLDGFMLAKALYELVYELNNRPDWVRIPLGGVLALLGRPAS